MIVSRVRRTLVERKLLDKGMKVLAACSGGPDSTAMLFVLARLAPEFGFTLASASVNHGLREAAAEEVEIVARQAQKAGVRFYPLSIRLPRKTSIQANARIRRYAALKKLANEIGAQRIAVGHTQDDQAESVLMRILRGAGIGGLSGTDPHRSDGVIRPLIDCRRKRVHLYAHRQCSEIVQDPSNSDERYERVRIRNTILPALVVENRAIVRHLADLADDARDQEKTIAFYARILLREACDDSRTLSKSLLRKADRATRRAALRLWIASQTGSEPGRSHIEQIDRAITRRGEIWLPQGWVVFITKDTVSCEHQEAPVK